MTEPKILLWDVESSFNRGYFFQLFKEITDVSQIQKERHLISIAYKWAGDKKAKVITIADFPEFERNPNCDKPLLKAFMPIMEEADYAVAHYGDGFDMKFVAGRLLLNGLPPMPPVHTIDTYKLSKKHFLLNSNKLDYIAKKLGFEGKTKMSIQDWLNVEEGSIASRRAAIKKMGRYNLNDVEVLEKVWDVLKRYTRPSINYNLFKPEELKDHVCPACGSDNLQRRGRVANKTTILQRLFCKACKSWHSVRVKNANT